MNSLSHSSVMDTEIEETLDERTNEERYRDLLSEVYEVSLGAQRVLELDYAKPEHTILILEDCLNKIEHLCSI